MLSPTRFLLFSVFCWLAAGPAVAAPFPDALESTVREMAAFGDRTTGSAGAEETAERIRETFEALGLEAVGTQRFEVAVRRHGGSAIHLPDRSAPVPIQPIRGNAVTPGTISAAGVSAPLFYVGDGDLSDFNGRPVEGSILLMEMTSGKNWLHAANLGARALIFIDREETARARFAEKRELSPIQFPRFWMPLADARDAFGDFESVGAEPVRDRIRLTSDVRWDRAEPANVYGVIPGADETLAEELLIVEGFYDTGAWVLDRNPGADQALSAAALLDVARHLTENPPRRSVLLAATAGHAETLAGLREMIWAVRSRHKDLRNEERRLKELRKESRDMLAALEVAPSEAAGDPEAGERLQAALSDQIKTEVDDISRELVRLRMGQRDAAAEAEIERLADRRLRLRRLGWRTALDELPPKDRQALRELIPEARRVYETRLADAERQLRLLKDAKAIRSTVKARELAASVSLHLSSRGDGVGAFNNGFMYALRDRVNRVEDFSRIDAVLRGAAERLEDGETAPFRDTLRPSPLRSWESYFTDRPALGGEVPSMAGYLGFTLATVQDARDAWGTPYDRPERVDFDYARRQTRTVRELIDALARAPELRTGSLPRHGFSEVAGRAKLLRHGELFADQAAPGVTILAFQGPATYHVMTDSTGRFHLRGMATKKLVYDKVILEGYRFRPDTGDVVWAIDKPGTGKNAYRVKMQRHVMETDLIMFNAKQTTIFNLLEPRTFRHMTKLDLIDGAREAEPMRYWYSRIDTRESIIASIYLEPGTHLKVTHSDTVLQRKMLLLNADPDHPEGTGYRIDDWPLITKTDYRAARDMWALLGPRIRNLESHGIRNPRIRELMDAGTGALETAEDALARREYDIFARASARSWALAARVYSHVDDTQRDVLFGVLFYIALFVPFAFCAERLLVGTRNIHKRIVAFLAILLTLILVVRQVHPAFELAYSPTVVILAFFIMGLSLLVTLIIFFRFESEMTLLQRRAQEMRAEEISRWKAFVSAFFLGVSNLRRRRLRTALTCATLVALTFTVMSFTSVKSIRHQTKLAFQPEAPYRGLLIKNVNWTDLPPESLGVIENDFAGEGIAAPRAWLEDPDRTRAVPVPISRGERRFEARGMVGLSAEEPEVTGLDAVLSGGRWFGPDERRAILLPERIARELGIDPANPDGAEVELWGMPFQVTGVFSGAALEARTDLDGEPLTPATFPSEVTTEMTEVEMEAMESGEDVMAFQSRYQHIAADLTVIVPYAGLMARGGHLKGVALRLADPGSVEAEARRLVDRFGLPLFSGERDGTFLYAASDAIQYGGVPNILIPILISVLIVLNTMIGSVYERKREIGIYTSVGLAPSHVGFLFIAEAMAFGVLSTVLGYLLAQVSAGVFAGTALWEGITVNYSSLAGVASMLLVMAVVLVSAIYPSRVAAEIAIPDVNRSWSLPKVDENRIDLTLPFLITRGEHDSVAGYVLAYLESHKDVSHGLFSTDDIVVHEACGEPEGPTLCDADAEGYAPCMKLSGRIWLAPFDFGIMQQVRIHFCPSADNPGFLEIRMRLERETGEANAWKRANKSFLNAFRKQLLIWRSLDEEGRGEHAVRLAVTV
ncbi:MAG: FtsX-like permease family protein [Desulfococcaceae bacterium]